jgi:hypothetical protein
MGAAEFAACNPASALPRPQFAGLVQCNITPACKRRRQLPARWGATDRLRFTAVVETVVWPTLSGEEIAGVQGLDSSRIWKHRSPAAICKLSGLGRALSAHGATVALEAFYGSVRTQFVGWGARQLEMLLVATVPFFHTPNFVLISVGTRPNYSLHIVRSYLRASAGASQAKAH